MHGNVKELSSYIFIIDAFAFGFHPEVDEVDLLRLVSG
jgi:hypothetical protein